ncbi:MAG: mechanosensitive ion channel domain-containing protein, partial [Dehalococcoidia bacterium]
MPFDSLTDDPVILRFIAIGVAAGGLTLGTFVYIGFRLIISRLAGGKGHAIAPEVLRAVRNPAILLLGAFGIFSGLLALPEGDIGEFRDEVGTTWAIVVILLVARAITNVVSVVINWYVRTIAPRTATQFDDQMLPLARRFLTIAVWGIAVVMVLDALSFSISPILGGLGITGIAVALALQPTLSNFFAGTYVLSDGAITVGDYIELNNGPAGYVIEVGWRSTKIRTWLNNLVIIPNSVMADTIIMNFSRPNMAMNILLTAGVSYSSNLQKVEEVSLEVTNQIIQEMPEASKTMEAYFGYD